jgi:hypothetical protein
MLLRHTARSYYWALKTYTLGYQAEIVMWEERGSPLAGARKACEGIPWTLACLDGQHTLPRAHQVRSLCEVSCWEPRLKNMVQNSAAPALSSWAKTPNLDNLEDL